MAEEPDPRAFENVEPTDIAADVAAGTVFLIDVRETSEWVTLHASGAVHIPLGDVREALPELAKEADGRVIAFICASGKRSAAAAEAAAGADLPRILNVAGGTAAWQKADLPTEP